MRIGALFWAVVGLLGLVAVIGIIAVLARSESETADPVAKPGLEEPVEPLPPGLPQGGGGSSEPISCTTSERVSWADAGAHLNTKVALIGPVTRVRAAENGAFVLEVGDVAGGANQAQPVMVVLTSSRLGRLPGDQQVLYAGKTVCAVGVLQRSESAVRLTVNEPDEIVVF